MIKELTQIAERLNRLPEAERAQWLERFAHEIDQAGHVYQLSNEERALIAEGIADLDAGRVVGGAALEKFWNRNKQL